MAQAGWLVSTMSRTIIAAAADPPAIAVATDGTPRRGFPYDVQTRHAANYSYQSPALADRIQRVEPVASIDLMIKPAADPLFVTSPWIS